MSNNSANTKLTQAHIFKTREAAEIAVRNLGQAGIDLQQLSLIGKGYHSEEHPVGFYTMGDRIKSWGGTGAFWGALFGLLAAPAMILFPGVGVVAALEGAVAVGGLSALGAALVQLGVRNDEVVRYQTAIKADEFVLLVHGDAALQARANTVLAAASAAVHQPT